MNQGVLHGLDLFSGIGGNSLALAEWVNTIAYCEQDRYAQAVLLSRMAEGILPSRPIWDDIRTLRGEQLPRIDIIVGGFPCQDISVAGSGAGLDGERSGLFFEIVRLAQETKSPFLFLENVPAIRTRGLDAVIRTLSSIGYDCRWGMLSAYDVGAPHKRERWFCLAYSKVFGRRKECALDPGRGERNSEEGNQRCRPMHGGLMADAHKLNGYYERHGAGPIQRELWEQALLQRRGYWEFEPDVGRVADGIPARMDQLKCLGNAVVPAQAREAFQRLMGLVT